ncbi:MAG: hypothetical protein P4M11_00305 [Candidatus Pacebacteria bacterium]|nr:hypothetical protein [Candidatus Paceibacterota bacterium]
MNQQQDGVAVLDRSDHDNQSHKPALTLAQRYSVVIISLLEQGATYFPALPDIEGRSFEAVRELSTDSNIFEPIVDALNGAGEPVQPNIGSVADVLAMTHEDVHNLACECLSLALTGAMAATRLQIISQFH